MDRFVFRLLQVRVTSRSDPHETQKATRLLTVGGSKADDKTPSCHVISITSNCSANAGPDGRRSKCGDGQWTVRALVSDDVSGLASVAFSDVSVSDEYVIDHLTARLMDTQSLEDTFKRQ